MLKIEIYEKAENIENMVQILEMITLFVQDGYVQGENPFWELFDDEQDEE